MNDSERRRYEMLARVKQFGIDNAGDFPAGIAATKFAAIGSLVDTAEAKSSAQQSGMSGAAQSFEVKDTARENLRDEMSAIARTARSMEYDFDGISDLFRFQRNMPDETMLAKARAFHTDSNPYDGDFKAYGLPSSFRADLNDAADAFETSMAATATATSEHVAVTADISATIREGMIAKRILDGIVRNKYANNPGKLAAWLSASHVEAAPKKPAPPPTS